MQATSLASVDTIYSADSIEFCPFEGYQDIFTCGTYQVLPPKSSTAQSTVDGGIDDNDEVENNAGSSTTQTQRTGRLLLFRVGDDQSSVVELQRIDTPAILDAKWAPFLDDAGRPQLAVADAKGHVVIYALSERRLEVIRVVEVADESTLCLSLDWSPHNAGKIITALSSGSLAHITISSPKSEAEVDTFQAHDFEPWITAFDRWDESGNTVWSGGDDCKLKRWDLRDTSTPTFVNKQFEAGVTTITSSPHTPHLLAVGSYDEHLRLYDTRSPRQPLATVHVGGGIWRTRFHPSPSRSRDILLACMHGGFNVVRLPLSLVGTAITGNQAGDGGQVEIVARFEGHESLAYGADWCRLPPGHLESGGEEVVGDSLIASCSFYDHKMHLWRA